MIDPRHLIALSVAALPACVVSDDTGTTDTGTTDTGTTETDPVAQESGDQRNGAAWPRPVLGKLVAEWSNVEASPCLFFSGPKHLGSEFNLGEAASLGFGWDFTTKVSFGPGAEFVGPIAIESPVTLTRASQTCPAFGMDFQFAETLVGEWTDLSWYGFSFVGTYHYSECEVMEDGTCVDDGCTIDADVVLRPRVTTDVVDAPFEVPDDACTNYCQHFVDVLDSLGGCADPFLPGYDDCVAGCAFNFGNPAECDEILADLLACEVHTPLDAYECFELPDGQYLGYPDDCFGAQMAWQACLIKSEPTGACSL